MQMDDEVSVDLTIDGRAVVAQASQSVLEAALAAGIYIPHLCSHPDLPVLGGCKLCTVEIDGTPKPVQACEVTVEPGMNVHTKTAASDHVRTVALELILAPHPKDCTSCRAYLNCELQALMQYTGVAHSRLRSITKRNALLGSSDRMISREMFRCIQCTRCVRACGELRGVGVLQLNHRDGEVYIGTRDDVPVLATDCRSCGACVEVCPTGALMDAPGLFATDAPKAQVIVPCEHGCPAHTEIPLYMALAGQGRYADSAAVFREKLTFPRSLGYVCSHPCESACKRGKLDEPLSIRATKKFAAENDTRQYWRERAWVNMPTGKKVAIVGGGPAGLTAAFYLARKGHAVTVFEREAKPGGMLTIGIPKYRLPQEIVDGEIGILRDIADFAIVTEREITSASELLSGGFDAVLVAVGAQGGTRPGPLSGDWANVIAGVDLCKALNAEHIGTTAGIAITPGATVTVYGGGNVGFDCARGAKKAGAGTVRIMCLESAEAILADPAELAEALDEGITIINSVVVDHVVGSNGRVTGLVTQRVHSFSFTANGLELETEPGPPDEVDTDLLVLATGQSVQVPDDFGMPRHPNGRAVAAPDGKTVVPGLFAAGDVVTGTRTVVAAIAAARRAASSIDAYLGGDGDIEDHFFDRDPRDAKLGRIAGLSNLKRTECATASEVTAEAVRCLHCDLRGDIEPVLYFTDAAFKGQKAGVR